MNILDNKEYQELNPRLKKQVSIKLSRIGGLVYCAGDNCNREFYSSSLQYLSHLLFDHGILMPTCSSHKTKRLQENTIRGFKMRKGRQEEKAYAKSVLRGKRCSLWHYGISKFFNNLPKIEIYYDEYYPPTLQ